ncbi:MAG: DnaJ domain-containing protein [Arenicellales bacterium]
MFIRLILALAALVAVMWFMGWYGKADPVKRNNAIKLGLLYFVGIALLLLVVMGRVPWLFAMFTAAVPFIHRIMRYRGILKTVGALAGRTFGLSTLTTLWLVLNYDMASRSFDGNVRQGEFEGRKLSELSDAELDALLAIVKDDFQSRAAVNAYILSKKGRAYTQQSTEQNTGANSGMSLTQAYEILGLDENASLDEVKTAHKRLIQKLHPDRGGSSYLATQINTAKDKINHSDV